VSVLELRVTAYDHPDAARLVTAVQRLYLARYGGADSTPVDAGDFDLPAGLFLTGYTDGQPVACGGWRRREGGDDPALRDGDVEIKRMYVVDAMRGQGFARAVLAELERAAAEAGARRMVLESGLRQPEAIALYRSSGYHPMANFGVYRCAPNSRCFAKPLD
jgi:GNAT superfamily N-acetyltransferase